MNNTVVVTVSGPVGIGKSAIAGEIEIALKAIGMPVVYQDEAAAQSEKNMTHADWQIYWEMYQPRVVLVERVKDVDVCAALKPFADRVNADGSIVSGRIPNEDLRRAADVLKHINGSN